ncbi:MAG TPA: GNAT family N-acetyltransferase [Anaeromyxobacter sp.]|nr:GNAT family N-acetyltransferase [Anaeromyxobacter sp.]
MPTGLSVRSPDRHADAADVVELVARTFGNYYATRRESLGFYLLEGHYDWAASAVGRIGGALVSHWGVWDYRMRIGRAAVRCAGIGGVATDADHRGKGHMARTAAHGVERIRARGYPLSILFGIDDFYHRFGYVAAWRESSWHLLRKDLPTSAERPPRLERIPFAPSAQVTRLHNQWNAGLTGTAIRPTFTTGFFHWARTSPQAWLWRDARGRGAGHVFVHEDGGVLVTTEATGDPDVVLASLGRLAARLGLPALRFETLPYGSALARRLRTLNCRYEQRYARDGEAMVRLVDLAGCLRAIEPELSRRLSSSALDGFRGTLRIEGPEGAAGLALDRGRVRVVPAKGGRTSLRAGWYLAQLLLGTDEPMETCEVGRIRLTGEAARLVPVLFPAQHPQLQLGDRY